MEQEHRTEVRDRGFRVQGTCGHRVRRERVYGMLEVTRGEGGGGLGVQGLDRIIVVGWRLRGAGFR